MVSNSKPEARTGCFVFVLLGAFGLPFAVIGLAAGGSLFRIGYDEIRMKFWSEVPCTVLEAELKEEAGSDSITHRVVARYRYRIGETDYFGKRVSTTGYSDNVGKFHQRVHSELTASIHSGNPFRCFVNPSRPEESILYRDGRWELTALQTWFALVFSAVGLGLLSVVFAAWIDERKKAGFVATDAAVHPWLQRADWVEGEIRFSDQKTGPIVVWVGIAILAVSIPGVVSSVTALVNHQDMVGSIGVHPDRDWPVRDPTRDSTRRSLQALRRICSQAGVGPWGHWWSSGGCRSNRSLRRFT